MNRILIALVLPGFMLSGCSSSDDDGGQAISSDSGEPISETTGDLIMDVVVTAATGGTFSSDDGRITIEIPPEALNEDSTLQITPAQGLDNPTATTSSAGDAFTILLDSELTLPAAVSVALDTPPVHPQLAETAAIVDDVWVRSQANFFRPSDNTVVSLIEAGGTIEPVFRTLQAESGDQVARGQDIFLNATFGNEDFFGGVVGLQELLNNISPETAAGVGAQVNIENVPADIVAVLTGDDFEAKQAALQSSDVTRTLMQANAVVGVRAFYDDPNSNVATSVGITCALCHTTVIPTEFELSEGELTALPIGPIALDGVPNTGIDVGTILSLTPFATNAGEETVTFLQGFGAGQFDARALPDNPAEDGVLNPTSIPSLWNFVDLDQQGYTYNWDGFFGSDTDPNNALASRDEFVYDLVMHANGAFGTQSSTVPLAAAINPSQQLVDALSDAEDQTQGNVIDEQSLLDLQSWERSIVSPAPAEFDEALAEEGFELFYGSAQCSDCHSSPEFTGPVISTSIVLNPPQGGLVGGIKTPGLRGIRLTAPYFHDGSAATLEEMVEIYSGRTVRILSNNEVSAIAEYMRSL